MLVALYDTADAEYRVFLGWGGRLHLGGVELHPAGTEFVRPVGQLLSNVARQLRASS